MPNRLAASSGPRNSRLSFPVVYLSTRAPGVIQDVSGLSSRRRLWRREGGSTLGTRPVGAEGYLGGLACGNLVAG